MKKNLRYSSLIFLLVILFSSCEKRIDDYGGKNIDNSIIGTWSRQYTKVDWGNMITYFTDTIIFIEDNSGVYMRYKFSDVENYDPFNFYTDENNLYIHFTKTNKRDNWTYAIKVDTLIIEGSKFKR